MFASLGLPLLAALQDQAANIDDALVNFQRGMTYVKRGLLPNRTSFINSVFSVF